MSAGQLLLLLLQDLGVEVIGGFVLPGQAVMQGLQTAPAHGALNLVEGTVFSDQHAQRLAIQLIVRFQFADRDAGLACHGAAQARAGREGSPTIRASGPVGDTPIWGPFGPEPCSPGNMGHSPGQPVRSLQPLAAAVLLLVLLPGCGLIRSPATPDASRQAAVQRRVEAQRRCRLAWTQLQPLLQRLQEQHSRLAALEAEQYEAGPGRPQALDPEEQRRLAPYDQEIEQEQYDQALAAWQAEEWQRRSRWRERQQARLTQARRDRDAAEAAVRRSDPEVLDPAAADGLNRAVLGRLERCAPAGP